MSKHTPFDLDIRVRLTTPEINGTTYVEDLFQGCTMPVIPSPGMSFMTGVKDGGWTRVAEVYLTPGSFTDVRLETITVGTENELQELVAKMETLGWKL